MSTAQTPPPPTFVQLFNSPPIGAVEVVSIGSTSISPMSTDTLFSREAPSYIIEDKQLFPDLMQFARNYLTTRAPGGPVLRHLTTLNEVMPTIISGTSPGDETRNIDLFTHISSYVSQFVETVDDPNSAGIRVRVIPCEQQGGVRSDRRFMRSGIDRLIIEY
ncbi:hypothetical protein AJ80_07519 [Polytolypa hystricis UAMH7299]|uniref:Uncharacterized protein n=1 Tax=Polytolypa hystricis (strain UAMH7299) TaxID=1447883 RepID=A0A2B7XMU9_POLH7|nr:hypothetical protein AJ80_07519 [Polytolypa hystricis UAMH7299]